MMVLIATLQGNGSANSLSVTNIPTTYGKIFVKGVCRVTSPVANGTQMFTGFNITSNVTSHNLQANQMNVTSWGESNWNNQATGRNSALVPGSGSEAGRMLNFELDIPNRNFGRNRLAFMWASSSVNASGPQHSEICTMNLNSTSQVTGLTFTNAENGPWSSNTTIYVYGMN